MTKILCTFSDFNVCAQCRIIEPYSNIKSDLIQFDIIKPRGQAIALNLDESLTYDGLIIQRACDPALIPFIHEFQDNGGKVIFELDDDVFHIPPANHARDAYDNGKLKTMREIISLCDALHVSTPELADAIPHPNKAIFLNGIDFSKYTVNYRDILRKQYNIPLDAKVVLWAGSTTHTDSLELIEQVIHQLVRDKIYVVLASNKVWLNSLGFYESDFLRITDWIPNEIFYRIHYIANVELAPLPDNQFNRCKSELRCIEAAACGVPVVCSSVAPYIRYNVCTGDGFIVEKERTKNWLKKVHYVLNNAVTIRKRPLDYSLFEINLERQRWWERFLASAPVAVAPSAAQGQ